MEQRLFRSFINALHSCIIIIVTKITLQELQQFSLYEYFSYRFQELECDLRRHTALQTRNFCIVKIEAVTCLKAESKFCVVTGKSMLSTN